MPSRTKFLDLISGRRGGIGASLCRAGLACLEPGYALAVALRNRRFARRAGAVHRVAVPVISVGNLTTGGTGKTPMVAWLARWFRERGLRVTLISRGYGAAAGARNDEAMELEERLPDVPHLLNPDRVAAAITAIEEFECQLLILDDAFQHRRIHRDLDIVLIDAIEPFGFGHLLPRGLLREPLSSLARADIVGLTRADLVSTERRERIRAAVERHAPRCRFFETAQHPESWLMWPDQTTSLAALASKRLAAFCGIGNPEGFRRTLHSAGLEMAGFQIFPDHHPYDRADLESLAKWAEGLHAEAIACTRKDLVKIRAPRLGSIPLYSLHVDIQVSAGRNDLETELERIEEEARLQPDGDSSSRSC